MAYRLLLGRDGTRSARLLRPGENLVGSHPGCDVVLDDVSVSRHHAVVLVTGQGVEIADLGSSNGTFLAGRRLQGKAAVAPGAEVAFGTLETVLEEIADEDTEPAPITAGKATAARPAQPVGTSRPTASVNPVQRFALGSLPRLAELALGATTETELAGAVGAALLDDLPATGVEIRAGDALLFRAGDPVEDGDPGERADGGDTSIAIAWRTPSSGPLYRPLVRSALALLRLHRRSRGVTVRTVGAPVPRPSSPSPASVDPVVRRIYAEATTIAQGDVNVLVHGESGTGKEVLARYLHAASPRAAGPLVALNCAALPRDLQESELFGVESGVATGVDARPGKFELADGGTLFLDEIGDMAAETQAKILRVLQEGEVFRLGARRPRPARVRVVSATNRDLEQLRGEGSFRDDLYHRIADWVVELPPLRDRPADIPNLAAHFLEREAARLGRRVRGISRAALRALTAYEWPGNVRQLEREIARAILFVPEGELLDTGCLQPAIVQRTESNGAEDLRSRLERFERREIARHLAVHDGDVPRSAESLGVPVSTLYRKIKQLGIVTRAADG